MTYQDFDNYITSLSGYPNLDFGVMGYSTFGQPMYYAHYGQYDNNQIIIEGSIHAREYLAGLLVVELAKSIADLNPEVTGGIYFIPNVNPDGVRLVLDGTVDLCPKLNNTYFT